LFIIRAVEPFFGWGLIDVSEGKKKYRKEQECGED
jgi:hypothetical protein